MTNPDPEVLKPLATKYLWWIPADQALLMPERLVAQVMNLGDFDDVQKLATSLGDDYLRQALRHAEAGVFSPRSWTYWHYRLDLAQPGKIPSLPQRRVA